MIVDNVKFTHRKVALSVQVDVSWCFFSRLLTLKTLNTILLFL